MQSKVRGEPELCFRTVVFQFALHFTALVFCSSTLSVDLPSMIKQVLQSLLLFTKSTTNFIVTIKLYQQLRDSECIQLKRAC